VSERIYEPGPNDSDNDRAVDIDQAFGENAVDELLDTSYSPPEKPVGMTKFGTTLAEQRTGETLDQRLAQEEPDPAMEVDLVEGEPSPRAMEDTTIPDDVDLDSGLVGEVPDEYVVDGIVDDGEVGDARAGRLLEPDAGIATDTEKDLVGRDVGVDAGAASAEEAAVHVINVTEADQGLDRDRDQQPTI
jgi:hypothetical protein